MASIAEANWQRLRSYKIPGVTIEQTPELIRISHTPPFWKQKASKKSNPGRLVVGLAWFGPIVMFLLGGNFIGAFLWLFLGALPAFALLFIVYRLYPMQMVAEVRLGTVMLDDNGQTATVSVDNLKSIEVRRDQKGTGVVIWDGIVPLRAFLVEDEQEGIMIKEALSAAIGLMNQTAQVSPSRPARAFEE